MVELDPIKYEISTYEEPLKEMGASLDLENKEKRIQELDKEMEEPGLWDVPEKAQAKVKLLNSLKEEISSYNKLLEEKADIEAIIEMGEEEADPDLVPEAEEMLASFKDHFETMRLATLLSDEYDDNNAIVTLHPGAGGTEACDWAAMLYRMYTRWAESKGFKVIVRDYLDGDEAGIKSVTFEVEGKNAYGLLQSEKGIHRLVRISPFNAAGKRQTSFVSCEVIPDIQDNIDIDIDEKDIRIDTYRSSGAGGQHINKTSSAIRITHFPTGIVVTCQNERSQLQNKEKAMQELKIKLMMLQKEANAQKLSDIKGEVKDIAWGSQIRSYFLQPYKLIKDLRTNEEQANADKVLDGDIDQFINAYLRWKKLQGGTR